ncbi:MAG: integral membrane protein [Neolewinella sp.]|jgi:integral membrane protein
MIFSFVAKLAKIRFIYYYTGVKASYSYALLTIDTTPIADLCGMQQLLSRQLGLLRVLAFIEGVSFLLILFVTMPLKYFFDMPEPNKAIGMVHGLLFISYCLLVLAVGISREWGWKKLVLGLLASIVPFGTFWADVKLFRE